MRLVTERRRRGDFALAEIGVRVHVGAAMGNRAHILLVDGDARSAAEMEACLRAGGHGVTRAASGAEALERVAGREWDLVVTELSLPDMRGVQLIVQIRHARRRLPIIMATEGGTADTAIEATKLGAFDYLLKPFAPAQLEEAVNRALRSSRLMSTPVAIGEAGGTRDSIVGRSRAMQEVYKQLGRLASTPVTVLIRGETGTGKELVARAIYQHGHRAHLPFIAVSCAAIPEPLLESELFGHERGAFTGAEARRIGRFEQAHNGTIFLDEVGELGAGTQAKLLRVLQERSVSRLGGRDDIPVDVRVIAATNRDLERAMAEGRFRPDLYYRLGVVTMFLPPLRERPEDVVPLAEYFLRRHARDFGVAHPSIDAGALALLSRQRWPGNVRQLENVIRQALLRTREYTICEEDLAEILAAAEGTDGEQEPILDHRVLIATRLREAAQGGAGNAHASLLEKFEREILTQAMDLASGNLSQAARWLGIARLTLRQKLLRHGLRPPA